MARGAAATMKRGPMRGRPTRGNNKQKNKADAAHDVASLPVTPPFFSFDRAELGEPLSITRVVAVTVPMADLRDRHALHEHVVKKLLHKPYSPSAEEKQQAATTRINNNNSSSTTNGNGKELCEEGSASCAARSHRVENSMTKEAKEDEGTSTPYVIIHMDHLEVHSDTARQVNSRGDVQLNVMLTITIAQVKRHGLLVGVAEESPFNACMQIRLPLSSTVPLPQPCDRVQEGKGITSKRRREQKEEEETMSAETANAGAAAPVLRMTVRCLEEEPVVAGQAVLVVSEPGGCLRCLALRPPRRAPGPFRLVCDDEVGTTIVCDVVETHEQEGQGKASGEGRATAAIKRRRE